MQCEAAKKAGIYEEMFLSFGSLLGYCRDGGFINGDDDMDVSFISENITLEQEREYIKWLSDIDDSRPNGLYEYRRRTQLNPVTGKLFWTSLMRDPKGKGFKCCNWFWFKHKSWMWHHKGSDMGVQSLIKGTPAKYFVLGDYVEFLGVKVRIPKYPGALLDWWYPNWSIPAGGSSSKKVLMKARDWSNPDSWKVIT